MKAQSNIGRGSRSRYALPTLFTSLVLAGALFGADERCLDLLAPPRSTPTDKATWLSLVMGTPEDLTARLVYADWLDEHGEPAHAAFIRTQIEMAGLEPHTPRWYELELKRRRLEAKYREQFLTPAMRELETQGVRFVFHHGMPEEAELKPSALFKNLKALTETGITRLTVLRSIDFARLRRRAESPVLLPRLRALNLRADTASSMERFFECETLTNLRELTLSGEALPDISQFRALGQLTTLKLYGAGPFENPSRRFRLDAFVHSRRLGALTTLHLGGVLIPPEMMRALAEGKAFQGLTELQFDSIGGIDLSVFERTPSLRLRRFRVRSTSLGGPGFQPLAKASSFSELQHFQFTNARFGEADLDALAACSSLVSLELNYTAIGNSGLTRLTKGALHNLSHLELMVNNLGAPGLRDLARSTMAKNLRHLGLRGNDFGNVLDHNAGDANNKIASLMSSRHLSELVSLDISEGSAMQSLTELITLDSALRNLRILQIEGQNARPVIAALERMNRLPKLEALSVAYGSVNNTSVKQLARSPYLRRLYALDLRRNYIAAASLRPLLDSSHLPHLSEIRSGVPRKDRQQLEQELAARRLHRPFDEYED